MDEKRIVAGNVTFAVRELHTGRGDGVSVEILASQAGEEVSVIRLDWFPDSPHYHYNPRTEKNQEIPLDPALVGDSMDWFLERLPDRLPDMIDRAGHYDIAGAVDRNEVKQAIPGVRSAAATARNDCGAVESHSARVRG